MGHADWQGEGSAWTQQNTGLTITGLSQGKNKFLMLQNCFYGSTLLSRLLIRHLQAFVIKSGKKPEAGLNLNSVCVFLFVEFCLQQGTHTPQGDCH